MKRVLARVSGIASMVVVLLLVITAVVAVRGGDSPTTITAQFDNTTGLYVGNDVQVIGVSIGKVTAIRPHGSRVDVTLRIDEGQPVARKAQALIMQSSLVTDRFVELTPAYTSGPTLATGDVISLDQTNSPANYDDVLAGLDDLLVALDKTSPDGTSIGELIDDGAKQLDGKGARIAETLKATRAAMSTVDGREGDLKAITGNLDALVAMLARRDATLRSLATSVSSSTHTLASQRDELDKTLKALLELTDTTSTFVHDNRELITGDLAKTTRLLKLAAANKDEIAETFDLEPLVAENLWRTYDPETRSSRIRVDMRNSGPFSGVPRSRVCELFVVVDCGTLTNPERTGALDPILDWPTTFFTRTW